MIARSSLLLWLALLAGFSPVLVAFARREAWSAPSSTLAAPVLIAICLWLGADSSERPRTGGAALIAAGLLLELVGIALEIWTVAWLGFPVAVIGLALWLGRPSWRVAVLALGLVAIPESFGLAASPGPESALLSSVCAAWHALGVDLTCIGPVARLADRRLELQPSDVGWTLAPLLAQLGWLRAVVDGASGLRALRRAAVYATAVVVVQPLAIGLALGLLIVSSEQVASAWLSHGVWIACTIVALGVTFSRRGPTQAEKRASRR